MRYFKQYFYKVGRKIEYKNVFSYIDAFFSEHNLRYDSMGYDLISLDDNCYKMVKKYPQLGPVEQVKKEYSDHYILSNMRVPGRCCDESTIRLIGSKIPRPYNFFDTHFYYRNVTFFSVEPGGENVKVDSHSNCVHVFGSYIELYRDFEGPQSTSVIMMIEVFDQQTSLQADAYAQRLSIALGKVKYLSSSSICMDAAEESMYAGLQQEAAPIVNAATVDLTEKAEQLTLYLQENFPVYDEVKFSIAKPLKKIGKQYGFDEYSYVAGGFYQITKRVSGGHYVVLEMDMGPMFRGVGAGISLCGAGFSYRFPCAYYSPCSQEEMDCMMTRIFETIAYFEEKYMPQVLKLYPDTPDWCPVCLDN